MIRLSLILALALTLFALVKIAPPDRFCGQFCFRSLRPAPYADADYFSPEFLQRSLEYPLPVPDASGVLRVQDYSSPWFNSRDGRRVTAFTPQPPPDRTVYLIGGSSVEGDGVPDEWTLASRLQKLLGSHARVVNYGFSGASLLNQNDLLRSLPIRPRDIVVFYDGVNDALRLYLLMKPTREVDGETLRDAFSEKIAGIQGAYLREMRRLRGFLAAFPQLVWLAGLDESGLFRKIEPPQFQDPAQMEKLNATMRRYYLAELQRASDFAHARGAVFLHVFQPWLVQERARSDYENELMRRFSIYPMPIQLALRSLDGIREEINGDLLAAHIANRDHSDAFAERPPGREVYLDFCHVNHLGNEILARKLATELTANEALSPQASNVE